MRFKILYHPFDSQSKEEFASKDSVGSFIVGFQVSAFSIQHQYNGVWDKDKESNNKLATCEYQDDVATGKFLAHVPQTINAAEGGEVIYSYDVVWVPSDVKWASRWDIYLQVGLLPLGFRV